MRVEVGRGGAGRGEGSQPAQPSLQALGPSSHPPGPALSLCVEGALRFGRDQLSLGQGQLRPARVTRALIAAVPRSEIAGSRGIKNRELQICLISPHLNGKPRQEKNECLPTYYVLGTVGLSSHYL